ncbi:MAG: EVE domain-containing protein [Candidatus Dormibacteria bacterium]
MAGPPGRSKPSARTYWMLVTSLENFRITRQLGFTVQGVKSRHRKKAEKMVPGDRVLYYVSGAQGFAATATVNSGCFEDRSPVWRTRDPNEAYPHRFQVRADSVLDEVDFIDAREIAPRMEFVRRWPPEYWTLAFQGNLHILSSKDFELIETEIQRSGRRARAEGA